MFGAGVCPCFSIPRVINNCDAMAEFERSLIQERVRAGLRNARAKGKQLGRPKVIADVSRIDALRAQGRSWPSIGNELGISGKVQPEGQP